MIPGRIENASIMFGAPQGWDEGRDGLVGVLPVRVDLEDGHTILRSAWFPTPAELEALLAGAPVILGVVDAGGHPVVQLGVGEAPQ